MSASVVANGGGAFTLTLSDQTRGWTQTTDQTSATAQLGSAEIIAEAPSDTNGVLPLSNFGTVNFTNVAVDTAPLGDANAAGLTMVSAGGVTEATRRRSPTATPSPSPGTATALRPAPPRRRPARPRHRPRRPAGSPAIITITAGTDGREQNQAGRWAPVSDDSERQ